MVERKIELKDIRVGDTIRFEWNLLDAHDTRTGVVAVVGEKRAITAQDVTLAHADWEGHTYFLVNRPTPPLPTEPGSRIKVTNLDGKSGEWIAKLSGSGSWSVFDLAGDDGAYWVQPFRIDEWVRIEIREVTP